MHKVQGTIVAIMDAVQVSEKFTKREFVIQDENGMYPQTVIFQTSQDKTAMLDAFQVGEMVEISFNLRGREWVSPQGETKYFNTLDAWRVERVGNGPTNDSQPPRLPEDLTTKADNDDLTF